MRLNEAPTVFIGEKQFLQLLLIYSKDANATLFDYFKTKILINSGK